MYLRQGCSFIHSFQGRHLGTGAFPPDFGKKNFCEEKGKKSKSKAIPSDFWKESISLRKMVTSRNVQGDMPPDFVKVGRNV